MDDNWKEELLGKVVPRENGILHTSLQEVFKPFANLDSVSRIICTNCSASLELNKEEANRMAEMTNTVSPARYSGIYFSCNACVCCSDSYTEVTIEQPV